MNRIAWDRLSPDERYEAYLAADDFAGSLLGDIEQARHSSLLKESRAMDGVRSLLEVIHVSHGGEIGLSARCNNIACVDARREGGLPR